MNLWDIDEPAFIGIVNLTLYGDIIPDRNGCTSIGNDVSCYQNERRNRDAFKSCRQFNRWNDAKFFLNKLPLLSSAMTWRSYAILPLWNLWKSEIPTFYHHRGPVEWLSEFSGESNVQRGIKILVNTQWVILINILRTILVFKFTGNRYVSVLCSLARSKDEFVRERIDNQRGIEIGSRRIQRADVPSMLRRIHLTFGSYVSVQYLLGETFIRRLIDLGRNVNLL